MPRWTDLYWPDDDPRWQIAAEHDLDPGFWPVFLNALERSAGVVLFPAIVVAFTVWAISGSG